MKPLDFVRKYNLNRDIDVEKKTLKFDRNAFIEDFYNELVEVVNKQVDGENPKVNQFDRSVEIIHQKWEGVSRKTRGGLTEGLWNFFFATKIAPLKEEMFPEWVAFRKAEKEELKRKREEQERIAFENRKKQRERANSYEFFDDWFKRFFKQYVGEEFYNQFHNKENNEEPFKVLNLSPDCTVEEVKKRFRTLAHKHHPDKGGNKEEFIRISVAAGKCLQLLQSV